MRRSNMTCEKAWEGGESVNDSRYGEDLASGSLWVLLLIFTDMALLFQTHYQSYHMNITAHPRENRSTDTKIWSFLHTCVVHMPREKG